MRIKAWDDAFAIDIPFFWQPGAPVIYYNKATYSTYSIAALDTQLPAYNLRGPPSII